MSIKSDAGELLKYFYDGYTQGLRKKSTIDVIRETEWEATRINNAIDYLVDKDALRITFVMGNINGVKSFFTNGLTSTGIDIIENENTFKTTFGFDVGIPGFRFSWTRER